MAEKNKASATAVAKQPEPASLPAAPAVSNVVKLPFVPKKIKAVTRAVLKLNVDEPVYVRILHPIYTGKEMKGSEKKADMKPAELTEVVNLATGEEMQLICGAVVKSTLEEAYENNGYVGKCFEITKGKQKEGKRYYPYSITEIEDPQAA